MVRGLECLQARFKEIQRLEEQGGAGPTDGATEESFEHRMQLQDKRTESASVPGQASPFSMPGEALSELT